MVANPTLHLEFHLTLSTNIISLIRAIGRRRRTATGINILETVGESTLAIGLESRQV